MGCKRPLKALYGQPPRGRGLRFRSRTRCPIRLPLRLIAAARQSQIPLQNPAGLVHEIAAIADPGSARRFAARAAWILGSSLPDLSERRWWSPAERPQPAAPNGFLP